MRTVFNENNTGHITKSYPMFLGDNLGLVDTVNVVNKEVESLKEKQRGSRWYPTEVSLTQDKLDMTLAPKAVVDIMNLAISWQHTQDSVAGRSIGALLLPHVTNTEAEGMIFEWGCIEIIHGEAYIHIVKQTRMNPDEAIKETYNNIRVLLRSKKIVEVFNTLYNMPQDLPLRDKKKIIAKVLVTIMAMEIISFMSSFCVTFAIGELKWFAGIVETVSTICRDELLHGRMSYELIKAQKFVDGWGDIYEEILDDLSEIIHSITLGEMEWNKYIFTDGRSLPNLTTEQLNDVNLYFHNVVCSLVGVENKYKVVKVNPCSHIMEKYVDRSLLQFAPQEMQHTGYRQGSVVDDLDDDMDLDFEI